MNFLRRLSLPLALSAPLVALAQISITMPPAIYGFGVYNFTGSAGYGMGSSAQVQTFTTPDATHTRLDRAEFRMAQSYEASDYQAYLVQWNSTSRSLSGAPLWTSAMQSTASLPVYSAFGVVSFETGGIDLQPDQSYALVLFDPTPSSSSNYTIVGSSSTSVYPGGGLYNFYRDTATTSLNDFYSAPFYDYSSSYDLAFGATFSAPGLTAVPEPATAVAGLGLAFVAGLFALRLQQRRRAATAAASSPA